MLQIGICDDEIGARQRLSGAVERILEKGKQDCVFFEFSSGEGLLKWLESHPQELDVLFLDIEMGGINGVETAKRVREADDKLILIFVTGFADFVFDGYFVGALGYVVKPIDVEKLGDVMINALGVLQKQSFQSFSLSNAEGKYKIPLSKILYFYSDRRQVVLVTEQKEYPFYGKLDTVAGEVGDGFVRIHQRYLVRGAAVTALEGGNVVVGGARLPISRAHRHNALLEISNALLKGNA